MTGSGFTQGDDFVAARVSIDVPTEGIQSLREMSQGIDRFRTSVEAGARSSATFVGYVNQMVQAGNQATEAYRNLATQLERTADLQQRSMGSGGPGMSGAQSALTMSRSAPQGYVDPWAGMGVGMGSGRMPTPNTADLQQQVIDPTRQLDPRKYLNAQAGRHRTVPGDLSPSEMGPVDLDAAASRVEARDRQQREQANSSSSGGSPPGRGGGGWGNLASLAGVGGLARNLFNEMQPGKGSFMGTAGVLARGMQGLGGSRASAAARGGAAGSALAQAAMDSGDAAGSEAAASGISDVTKGLSHVTGALGTALAGGVAGMGMLQKGGGMYQSYKNMGSIRGGGAAEGFGTEMAMRGMAMNPFLTTEQSRQVIMAGLTEGYSGKQFDNVTQFMASNLKDMNMQVSESVNLLRKNVNEGGQSIGGLASSLAVLKEMSKSGGMSLPDLKAAFESGTATEISHGVSGGVASQDVLSNLGGWSDNLALKGQFSSFNTNAMGSAAGAAMVAVNSGMGVPGLNPKMMAFYMSRHGMGTGQMSSKAISNIIRKLGLDKMPPDSPQYANALSIFMQQMAIMDPSSQAASDPNIADQWVQSYLHGKDPAAEGAKKLQANVGQVNGVGFNVPNDIGAIGTGIMDMGKGMIAGLTGNAEAAENARLDLGKTLDNAFYNTTADTSNPRVDSIIKQYGASSVEVVGSDGSATSLTGDRSQTQGLASGQLKIRRKGEGGGGFPLSQFTSEGKSPQPGGGAAGPSQTNVNFSPAQVQISFGPSGITASPNPVQLTPNQQAVNSGVGSNTMNNPPPGDGYGYYSGRIPGQH